jgi:hypothetical protein
MKHSATSLLAILFSISALFMSCSGSPKHPAELATADSLNQVMKSMDTLFLKVDSIEVKNDFEKLVHSLAYIQFNLKDTLPREDGLLLSHFFNLKRPLGYYVKLGGELNRKIKEEKERCLNLSHDLKHNTLNSKLDVTSCVKNERNHVTSLILSAEALLPAVANALKDYKELVPKIDSKVEEIKAKGGKEPPVTSNQSTDQDDD